MIYDDSRKETFVKCLKSPISETAGRRALKTKFSPPPCPPHGRLKKKIGPSKMRTGPCRWRTGPCRWRTGPCRWRTESNFTTISIVQDRADGERDRADCERDRADGERDRADCERDRADCERDRAECERKATSFTIFRGVGGQIDFSPITRY